MYLLRTSDATLHHFNNSRDVKYAILSHVWHNPAEENSFLDILRLSRQCAHSGDNPRDRVCDKIRQCCIFAELAGYQWVWIDTCCIDHNSSAELSEAINSMFAWYVDADVCYAYLYDVDDDQDPASPDSAFRNSRWFTRGWTLQELIAPSREIFLSRKWHTLGSKHMLASVIEHVTQVHSDILTHKRPLDSVSVAQRMSWASKRVTTRVEDRAYSLLGIFGISIPTIYGEGDRAFVRLQEEILRRIPDQTIFAWGPLYTDIKEARRLMEHENFGLSERANDIPDTAFDVQARLQDLLAPSPSEFVDAAGFRSIAIDEIAARFELKARIPHYNLTSYGIQFHIPLSNYSIESWKSWMARAGTATTQHVQVGLLACENADGDLIVLFLRRANKPSAGPQYAVGEFIDGTEQRHYYRGSIFATEIVVSEEDVRRQAVAEEIRDEKEDISNLSPLDFLGQYAQQLQDQPKPGMVYSHFTLSEIYIHHPGAAQVVSHTRQDGTVHEMMATRDQYTFTLPSWLLTQVAETRGLLPVRGAIDDGGSIELCVPSRPSPSQMTQGYRSSVSFIDPVRQEKLTISVGVGGCNCLRYVPVDCVPLHRLWIEVHACPTPSTARRHVGTFSTRLPKISGPVQTTPTCERIHVDFTMVRAEDFMIKTVFGDEQRKVEIEFRKWEGFERIRPIRCQTHVITFDVSGTAYQRSQGIGSPRILSPAEVLLRPEQSDPDNSIKGSENTDVLQDAQNVRGVRFSESISVQHVAQSNQSKHIPLSRRQTQHIHIPPGPPILQSSQQYCGESLTASETSMQSTPLLLCSRT